MNRSLILGASLSCCLASSAVAPGESQALPTPAVVTFTTKNSVDCIGVNRALKDNGTQLGRFKCDNHPNQRWLVTRQGNGYRFQNQHSQKRIGVDFASTKVGAKIIQFRCDDSANQTWTLLGELNPVVKISNAKSRLCLGVDSAERLALQLDCNNAGGIKEWRIVLRRPDSGPD
jgi:Ricin-type beta-trefoil lectin domain